MARRLWSLLARLVPFRQPVSLHDSTWRDRVDPEPYGRLDIADGLPRPARPVSDADDLARQLVAEHAAGRHVTDRPLTPFEERMGHWSLAGDEPLPTSFFPKHLAGGAP